MSRVAIVGGVTLDILFQVPRMPEPHEKLAVDHMMIAGGGSASNVAHWLARLGHDVKMFSVVGDDPMSGIAVDALAQAGVDVSGIRRVPGIGPSIMAIFTNGNYKSMVGGGPWEASEQHWQSMLRGINFASFERLHTFPKAFTYLFENGRRPELIGVPVSADLNGTYAPEMIAGLDLAFSNHDEISAQAGTSDIKAKVAADLGKAPYSLVVTRAGEEVACFWNGDELRIKPKPVQVIDRTGGGDAFCAGYLHAADAGASPEVAVNAGLYLAGTVISALGCRPLNEDVDAALLALKTQLPT